MVAVSGPRRGARRPFVALNVAAQVLLFCWLLVVLNSWGFRQSWRFDLTRDQRYEVPDETRKALAGLTEDVEVVALFLHSRSELGAIEHDVLMRGLRACREFELLAPRFRVVEVVDSGREPEKAAMLRERRGIEIPNRIYLLSGEAREVLAPDDLAELRRPTPGNPEAEVLREFAGEAVSNALVRIAEKERPRVAFSYGSGEVTPGQPRAEASIEALMRALRDRGFELAALDLRTVAEIPAETRLLVIVAGGGLYEFQPLPQPARAAVAAFVERGGCLLLFLPAEGVCGLEGLLKEIGIRPRGDQGEIVAMRLERGGRPADHVALEARAFNAQHPIASGFRFEDFRAELYYSRALAVEQPAEAILSSDAASWLETNPSLPRRDAEEEQGSFPLMAAYGGSRIEAPGSYRGKVVVFGTWTAALDRFFAGDLRRLILNSAYWLTDRDRLAAGIGRDPETDRVRLTAPLLSAFFWAVVVATPLAALLGGLFVFWVRRR